MSNIYYSNCNIVLNCKHKEFTIKGTRKGCIEFIATCDACGEVLKSDDDIEYVIATCFE